MHKDRKSIYITVNSYRLWIYVSGHDKQLSGPSQVFKWGNHSFRRTTTHDILHLFLFYLVNCKPSSRSSVWEMKNIPWFAFRAAIILLSVSVAHWAEQVTHMLQGYLQKAEFDAVPGRFTVRPPLKHFYQVEVWTLIVPTHQLEVFSFSLILLPCLASLPCCMTQISQTLAVRQMSSHWF